MRILTVQVWMEPDICNSNQLQAMLLLLLLVPGHWEQPGPACSEA